MKNQLTKLVLLLLIQAPVYAAEGGDENTNLEISSEPEYISQSDVTKEDYNTMANYDAAYDECLQNTSRAEKPNYNDPRHVVDVAMKKCAVKLEELNEWLTEKRFPPGFKQRHIRKLSSNSVGDVMPQVMFMMSTKQQ